MKFIFAAVLIFTTVSNAQAAPVTKTTKSGHIFTLITDNSALGESWKDESGLIWGDVLKNADGSKSDLTQSESTNRCVQIGARLPTQEEVEKLWGYFGMESVDGYYTGKFIAEILPNIDDYLFNWSSTQKSIEDYPSLTGYVYSAYTTSSATGYCAIESKYHARCVTR